MRDVIFAKREISLVIPQPILQRIVKAPWQCCFELYPGPSDTLIEHLQEPGHAVWNNYVMLSIQADWLLTPPVLLQSGSLRPLWWGERDIPLWFPLSAAARWWWCSAGSVLGDAEVVQGKYWHVTNPSQETEYSSILAPPEKVCCSPSSDAWCAQLC